VSFAVSTRHSLRKSKTEQFMKNALIHELSRLFLALSATFSTAQAATITFADKASFLATTAATDATGALPNLGFRAQQVTTIGAITLTPILGHGLWVGTGAATDWTPLLPGHDIAIDDTEMLDVSFSPAFSLGFDFAEPSGGIDSTFSITLLNGVSPVGSFTFDAPDDVGAFVGVWSDASFNRAQIRETVGGSDDEFFGHFYTGTAPLPEPSIFALGIFGAITALGFSRRRKSDDNDA
jgi:hypothetical protein